MRTVLGVLVVTCVVVGGFYFSSRGTVKRPDAQNQENPTTSRPSPVGSQKSTTPMDRIAPYLRDPFFRDYLQYHAINIRCQANGLDEAANIDSIILHKIKLLEAMLARQDLPPEGRKEITDQLTKARSISFEREDYVALSENMRLGQVEDLRKFCESLSRVVAGELAKLREATSMTGK